MKLSLTIGHTVRSLIVRGDACATAIAPTHTATARQATRAMALTFDDLP